MEAFVYCWTDKVTNKLYVGSHKGTTNDGYICSSKLMLDEYKKRPDDFSRQIIAEGNLKDIRKLEAKILQSVNARLNEQFYNKHDNDGFYFDGWKSGTHTEEHLKNMSIAASKRKRTEEHINKLHEGRRASKNSQEHKAALIASRIGSTHNEETKKKMSEKKLSNPQTKLNASEAGKKSQTARKASGYYETPEYKEKCKLAWEKRKFKKLLTHGGLA